MLACLGHSTASRITEHLLLFPQTLAELQPSTSGGSDGHPPPLRIINKTPASCSYALARLTRPLVRLSCSGCSLTDAQSWRRPKAARPDARRDHTRLAPQLSGRYCSWSHATIPHHPMRPTNSPCYDRGGADRPRGFGPRPASGPGRGRPQVCASSGESRPMPKHPEGGGVQAWRRGSNSPSCGILRWAACDSGIAEGARRYPGDVAPSRWDQMDRMEV